MENKHKITRTIEHLLALEGCLRNRVHTFREFIFTSSFLYFYIQVMCTIRGVSLPKAMSILESLRVSFREKCIMGGFPASLTKENTTRMHVIANPTPEHREACMGYRLSSLFLKISTK